MEQKAKYFITPEQEEEMRKALGAAKGGLMNEEPLPEDIKDAHWLTDETMNDLLVDSVRKMDEAFAAFLPPEVIASFPQMDSSPKSVQPFPEEVTIPPDNVIYGMLREGVVIRVSAVFDQPERRGSCLVTEEGIAYYIDSDGILCDDETILSYEKEQFVYELPKLLDTVFRSCDYRKISPNDKNNQMVLLSDNVYRLSSKVLATYSKVAGCLVVTIQPSDAKTPLLAFCK